MLNSMLLRSSRNSALNSDIAVFVLMQSMIEPHAPQVGDLTTAIWVRCNKQTEDFNLQNYPISNK